MEAIILKQDDRLETLIKAEKNYKKTAKDKLKQSYMESRLENLEDLWKGFKKDHLEIVAMIKKEEKKKVEYFTKDSYEQFEETYTSYKTLIKEHLKDFTRPISASASQAASVSGTSCDVMLPQIQLPKFGGSYEEWQGFYDLFVTLIHDNALLSNVQKLHYLKSSLSGEPENLLRNLTTTDANYAEAWKQLKRRYNNKRYNANEIFKRLFNQKAITTGSSSALKMLLDTTTSCLKSLDNIGVSTTSWDAIVSYLVVTKLDQESRKQWEYQLSVRVTDDMPTWAQLVEFIEARFRALEMVDYSNNDVKPSYHNAKQSNPSSKHKSFHSTTSTVPEEKKDKNSVSCGLCSGQHLLYQCKKFGKQSPQERVNVVESKRLCYNCFSPTHSVRQCHQATCCRRCGRRHHMMLHFEREQFQKSMQSDSTSLERDAKQTVRGVSSAAEPETRLVANFSKEEHTDNGVLLATAAVKAKSKNCYTQSHVIKALLDQGSQASFVTAATVQLLGLKRVPVNVLVSGLGDGETRIMYMVSLVLESRHRPDISIHVEAFVMSSLTSFRPVSPIRISDWPELRNLPLAESDFQSPSRIDVLLGAEVYSEIILNGLIKIKDGPIVQNSVFGWIVSGRVQTNQTSARQVLSLHIQIKEDIMLKKFWALENEPDGISKRLTKEEQKCEQIFESTVQRDQEGRYVVRLPFRHEDPDCQYGQFHDIAMKRFQLLEKKLLKNPSLRVDYKDVIDGYEHLNHMSLITNDQELQNQKAIYLPHHAVVREDKETTKVRVVFDASCKGVNNVSLNDCLLVGPRLQQDLRHILMRWRYHSICLVADLVKMYRQVRMHPDDTDYQRILWRSAPEEPILHYRLLTVTFGTASAPYLAVKSMQQLAKDESLNYQKLH